MVLVIFRLVDLVLTYSMISCIPNYYFCCTLVLKNTSLINKSKICNIIKLQIIAKFGFTNYSFVISGYYASTHLYYRQYQVCNTYINFQKHMLYVYGEYVLGVHSYFMFLNISILVNLYLCLYTHKRDQTVDYVIGISFRS